MRQSPTLVAEDGGGCGELRLLPSSAVPPEYSLATDHSEGDYYLVTNEVGPKLELRKPSTSNDHRHAESAYQLGASFPFLNFSSSGPSTPPPPTQLPSFSEAVTEDKRENHNRFRDLGRWISFHGGRKTPLFAGFPNYFTGNMVLNGKRLVKTKWYLFCLIRVITDFSLTQ